MVVIRQKRQVFPGQRGLAAIAVLIAAASGCKSTSWAARPSWLGGSPAASSLGSAPTFNGGVPKPSETAKPYPTTGTPEGYVLADAPGTGQAGATPASVTYGTTPPPTAQAAATPAAAPPAASQPATGGIAPQVGPYAALTPPASGGQAVDPAASVTAGLASAPSFEAATPPAATAPGSLASERMADARTSGWAATPPSQSPLADSASPPADDPGSRYGGAGSRFGGGSFRPAAPAEDAVQQAPSQPAIEPFASQPPASEPTGLEPPPPSQPGIPAQPASPAPNPALPGTLPPPTRRPDPGYRPGGTSSYRPARQLLDGQEAAGGVQPVGFNGQ